MDDKPCRWLKPKSIFVEGSMVDECDHPLLVWLCEEIQAACNGCPCHDPLPEPPDTQRTEED